MKNIYKLLKGVIIMMIAIAGLIANAGTPLLSSLPGPMYVLYPPTNLTIDFVCAAWLNWDKPQNPGGITPTGLLGYRIYRDGNLIHYNLNPDSLSYWDYLVNVGLFTDSVTAYYDLTSYGQPGAYGESSAASASLVFSCGAILPFFEPWDMANFSYQDWQFSPSQGNWVINTSQGNPLPSASFTGTPAHTNYDNILFSVSLYCSIWTCANIYLEFDTRLTLTNATSQETLITEIYLDNIWQPKDTLVNDISTGWVHHKIDITEAGANSIRVGFRATGINSADIGEWDVDNIEVYAVCFKPPNFNLSYSNFISHLTWEIPCTGKKLKPDQVDSSSLIGYNIYRTDYTGLPPFIKLNLSPVIANEFDDYIPTTTEEAFLCYYVTALYQDSWAQGPILCESPGDTLCVHIISGIPEKDVSQVRIFPNPVSEVLNIETDKAFTGIEILNFLGEKIYSESFPGTKNFTIPMKDRVTGIYLLKIRSVKGIIVRKVLKKE
jgi:Secretion system C-terminal sorting domain